MSSLGVRLLEGVHCHPLLAMSKVSLLPVVKVVVSGTAWGPSLTQWASNPPEGSGVIVFPPVSKSACQSVGRPVEFVEFLTMFPSSSKMQLVVVGWSHPTSVSASAVLKNGTAIARVIRVITMIACMYRFESIHFVLYEISPIVDIVFPDLPGSMER